MTTILLINPQQAHQAITGILWPTIKANLTAGKRMVLTLAEYDEHLTDKQRRYYHGVVLKEIVQQATANGQKFPLAVWKEHFREKHLGSKRKMFTDPFTGKKYRRYVRVSTEDLGVKKYSDLIERVTAYAATDLGVKFSVLNWRDYAEIDPETGEIV